ncbi:M14 family zinc carboxypeptidase [Umezawaea beigongshangensis]|uniref:M14 family zinc carboxypeptidase n=1 Tax=Umezawaea beigongshangensis TaxID=2780383 RepID=UPI0027DC7DDC|nr:M14 family zinc carboxypeptidase [Umezawaea beigongshangensis]
MRPRSLLTTLLTAAALVLPAALTGVAQAAPTDVPLVWRVPLSSPSDVRALTEAGFDVVEPEADAAFVIGDRSVARELARLGHAPTRFDTVYKELPVGAADVSAASFYGGYRTVAEHEAHLSRVASAHPDLVTSYDIGDSWRKTQGLSGGHDVRAVCITKKQAGDCQRTPNSTKPRFTMMAQVHARELSTGELAWRWIDFLVDGYGTDADATSILDTTEVWVVPIANPDGVDLVAAGGNSPRLQRKNANTSRGSCTGTSIGVDLNRNSSFKWGGDSNSACAETYQGTAAKSEPETLALESLFSSIYPDQRGSSDTAAAPLTARGTMITLHSYGNSIVIPWGWTRTRAPNDAQMRAFGAKMAAHNGYLVGTNAETVGYDTTGTQDDYTYGVLGVASVTFEVGASSGTCGGFFPAYSCVDSTFWPKNRGAFVVAAKAAAAPYRS